VTEEISISIALVIALGLDLIIVAANSSLTNVNRVRLLSQQKQQPQGIDHTLALLDTPRRFRACLRILQMVVRFLLAGLLVGLFAIFGILRIQVTLGLLALMALLFAWIEMLFYEGVAQNPEQWIVRLTPIIRSLGFILYPFTIVPIALSKEFHGQAESGGPVTEDELKSMVDAGQQDGVLEQEEREMIYSIFNLGDTLAREIMVPRMDVLALDVLTEVNAAADAMLASGHSRVPVYEESIDNILGLLYAKDLLSAWREGDHSASLRSLLRPAYFIPEAKKVDELLAEMQAQRIHMAVVVDEYGGMAGLVTMEDIVEEIVGEIRDEYDEGEEGFYQQIGPEEYVCSGRMDLDDFNELMNSNLPVEEADTLAGLVYSRIGHIPNEGEQLVVDGLRLIVEQVFRRRIRKIRVQRVISRYEENQEENNVQ
jgi:CBS domain containing-hemolysin-like protein